MCKKILLYINFLFLYKNKIFFAIMTQKGQNIVMKVKNLYYLLIVGFLLFSQGCGEVDDRGVVELKEQKHLLSEDNYISLAKYHFSKSSNILLKNETKEIDNDSKFRSYSNPQDNNAVLKVTYVAPFDKIESMRLESKNRYITLKIDNNFVTISLFEEDTLLKSDTESKIEFNNFGVGKIGEML